jgi:hypothetical protein
MQANIGDTIVMSIGGGQGDEHRGEIVEVRGESGQPPYVVRFADGRETLVFPGPDCTVVPA